MSRYVADESEFEPGSSDQVLRNLQSITDPEVAVRVETELLLMAYIDSLRNLDDSSPITASSICEMHRTWLGSLYSMAGAYRTVNVSKDGLFFCAAPYIAQEMDRFERTLLSEFETFVGRSQPNLQRAVQLIAKVHAELMLIHPFREW